jgi:hypothetical protein
MPRGPKGEKRPADDARMPAGWRKAVIHDHGDRAYGEARQRQRDVIL